MAEEKGANNLSLLYQENAKVVAIFWEWRNKIITYFFTAVGALFALAGWLYQQHFGRWVSFPFLVGVFLSYLSLSLDQRNADILRSCYRIGEALEGKVGVEDATYKAVGEAHSNHERATYTRTLHRTYLGVAAVLLLIAVLFIVSPIYPANDCK